MRTATVRQVQHNLGEVLRWVEDGEEVQITKRRRVVALLSPARPKRPALPDFTAESRAIWGKKGRGKSIATIIRESRAERL